ncbi:MAG: hypothetical protein U5R31_02345 [Acidimicrobiia bacterium]|nr:hypothetical protein [Acidimicrobiia bacterium]
MPIGKSVNTDIACVSPMMCARDEGTAIARGVEGGNFFGYSLAHYYVFGDHVPGRTNVWEEFQERRGERGYRPEAALAARQETLGAKAAAGDEKGLRGCVGTPDQLREYLRRFEEAGVDQMIFVLQAGKNRHEHIMESIELFGTEVLPEFAERDASIRAEKAERMAPLVEAAFERRTETPPPMPDDYVMRAIPKQMVENADNDQGREWMERLAERQATGERDETLERGILG